MDFISLSENKCLDFSNLPENIKDYISTLQHENHRHTEELQALQTQLNNLTAVVDFADSTKIAEIADLKQRHQQELDTINILMEGKWNDEVLQKEILTFCRLETIRDRVGDARGKYETEVNMLRRKMELLQQENYELKSKVADDK